MSIDQFMELPMECVQGHRQGTSHMKWVDMEIQVSHLFYQRIEMASLFKQTGRQTESIEDLSKGALNFKLVAMEQISKGEGVFKNEEMVDEYARAILSTNKIPGLSWMTATEKFLDDIIHSAHILDLYRIYDNDGYKNLLKLPKMSKNGKEIGDKLKAQSSIYLETTGDRNTITSKGYRPIFWDISNDVPRCLNEIYSKSLQKPTK